MTKKMGLMALGLSMVLLSGCGSSGGGGTGGDTGGTGGTGGDAANTPDGAKISIVGTWATGCVNESANESESETLIFNADGTGSYEETEYDGADCNSADEVDYDYDTFSYALGAATKGSAGEDAVEIDINGQGWDYYTMTHFDNSKLFLADDNGANDGDTPATRANEFSEDYALIKQ